MVVDATALMMGSRGRPTLEASEKGPHPYLFRALERAYNAGIRSSSSKPLPTKNEATCCLTSINSARGGSSSRESTSQIPKIRSAGTSASDYAAPRLRPCRHPWPTRHVTMRPASLLGAPTHIIHIQIPGEAPAPRRTCLPSFPPTRIRPVTNPDRRRRDVVRHKVAVAALP